MRTMRGVSNALVAALLALLLVAALPLAAAAEGTADSARGQRAEGAQAESGDGSDAVPQAGEPNGSESGADAEGGASGEGAPSDTGAPNGESGAGAGTEPDGGTMLPEASDAMPADSLSTQGEKTDDSSQAADLREQADAVISIDASGDTMLELKDDGTYELTGAVTGSGSYDASTVLAMASDSAGTVTLKGTGSLASATLMEWPGMGWEPAGFNLVVAAGASVAFGDVVECMNLTVYGTLRSQWSFSGDDHRWYAVGCYGALVIDGGSIDVAVKQGSVNVDPVVSVDSGYGLDCDEPVVPQSRIANGGSLSIANMEGEGWGNLLSLNNADLLIENGSLSLAASDSSNMSGIGGYSSKLTVDGGSVNIDVPNGSGASLYDMVLGTEASVEVTAGYSGIALATLQIGAEDAPSRGTISVSSIGTGLEVTESTEIFGAGKEHTSITVAAGDPEEYGWIGGILRGARIADTKISSSIVSKEAVGLLISCNRQIIPTMATASIDLRDEAEPEPEPEIPTVTIDNSTIIAHGTEVGLETEGERFLISDTDIEAVASGDALEGLVAPLATPVTYPSAAIRSSEGQIDLSNTTVDALGTYYGWLGINYTQPEIPYDPYDVGDEDGDGEWDWGNTRIFAHNGSRVNAEGDIAGIALAGSLAATSAASVTGTARLTDPYEPEANDVAAIAISNYKAGKNEIKADGGTVTERYVVPVSEAIADNEADAFNPYAGAWHMASPAHYSWTADHPAVLLASNESGVYTTSGTGNAETGLSLTATRTAPETGEKVVLGPQGSAHNVVLLGDIKPQDTVKYLVRFEPNGGAPKPADQTVARGSVAAEPTGAEKPELEGYTLEGWYTDQALTTKWSFAEAVMGDMTLHAKWIENDVPVPPGPEDPDPEDPKPIDPKPVDAKPASSGKTLARTGDSLVLPIVAGAVLLGAGGVALALAANSKRSGRMNG